MDYQEIVHGNCQGKVFTLECIKCLDNYGALMLCLSIKNISIFILE